MLKDLRPVVVRGPVVSGVARVVVDEASVVVVTQKDTFKWFHDGDGLVQAGTARNKFVVAASAELEEQVAPLTVVQAGGCTCGKPWLKTPDAQALLDGEFSAPAPVAV